MRDLLSIGTSRGCEMIGTGIGLGLSGFRVNPPGALPVLDLRFSNDKTLVAFAGPTPSFSRASSGTYFGANGVLTSAAVNEPRFDHVLENGVWVSKGLLIEEQRVNYVKYANDLSTNWTNESGATREYNSIASPDGGTNATKVNVAVSDYPGLFQNPLLNAGSGIYTYSIFAKKGTKDWLWILNTAGAGGSGTFFNISNGTIGTVNSGYSATIANCGNGWYRCSLTTTTSALSFFQFGFSDANNSIRPASTGHSYVYGAQIELGSFVTSFIPNNTASSVTRSADVCQITGSAFTNLWNATEGSFSVDNDRLGSVTSSFSSGFPHSLSLVDGSNLVRMGFYGGHSGASPTGEIFLYNGSSRITAGSLVSGSNPIKISGAYKANDFAASLNGAASLTSSSGALETVVQMNIGAWASSQYMLNGHIARLRYYPTRLTNAKLQELST